MKGIHIHVIGADQEGNYVRFDVAGQDRRRTLEAAAGRLPEHLRTEFRKKAGRCIEVEDEKLCFCVDRLDEKNGCAVVDITPCEVIA